MSVVKLINLVPFALGVTILSFLNSPASLSETVSDSLTTEKSTTSKCSYIESGITGETSESVLIAQVLGDEEVCYNLYVACIERNPRSVPCDDCLRICLNNNGEWPFWKCRIPAPAK